MSENFTVSELNDYEANRRICDKILSKLPDWFGPYEIYQQYLDDLESRPVFGVVVGDKTIGIMALTQTSDASIDIHVMAVNPDAHGNGIGHALVNHAKTFARNSGAKFLTVKTLGPTRENADYAKTRSFYERQGFSPLEEFVDFWGDGYPMLLYCQAVD